MNVIVAILYGVCLFTYTVPKSWLWYINIISKALLLEISKLEMANSFGEERCSEKLEWKMKEGRGNV